MTMLLQVLCHLDQREVTVYIISVSGDDTCFWRGVCNKLEFGHPYIFFLFYILCVVTDKAGQKYW